VVKLSRSMTVLSALTFLFVVVHSHAANNDAGAKIKVDEHSFKCITDMTHVRHFYVDNLLGNVKETAAVAQVGKGDYPVGSVIQLVPTEAMVKQQPGFNPETRDWEFFALDVDKDGSKIFARGFQDVNNRFGLNCFTCHKAADTSFDFVCEQDHGCAPIPITRPMFAALQRTDPRCPNQGPVLAEDKQALVELEEIVKTLKADVSSESK
jgi:hypothetical protein